MLIKQTAYLRLFGLAKIPLLFVVRPTVLELDESHCIVKIPLNYWTRNHLKCMYFGALAIGADLGGGLLAMDMIRKTGKKIGLIFKDFHADYLKRAEDDTHFACHDGQRIKKIIEETLRTGRRVNLPLHITATTPKLSGAEPVAKFVLTLSLKA